MVRGIIVGCLAFAIAFAVERMLASMKEDLARYDAMRKMSGEEPLAKRAPLNGRFVDHRFGAEERRHLVRYLAHQRRRAVCEDEGHVKE